MREASRWRDRFGRAAERHVAAMVGAAGLMVVEQRYRTPRGEVDVVAKEAGTLVFIEVKARRGTSYGDAAEAVGWRKQRRIVAAARDYLREHPHRGPCRFDVVAVESRGGRIVRCDWLRDAFRA